MTLQWTISIYNSYFFFLLLCKIIDCILLFPHLLSIESFVFLIITYLLYCSGNVSWTVSEPKNINEKKYYYDICFDCVECASEEKRWTGNTEKKKKKQKRKVISESMALARVIKLNATEAGCFEREKCNHFACAAWPPSSFFFSIYIFVFI